MSTRRRSRQRAFPSRLGRAETAAPTDRSRRPVRMRGPLRIRRTHPRGSSVVAAGTFDGVHDGHRYYLRSAKRLGDHLTVIVARDATVPLLKGKRARRNERQRREAVAKLPDVDRALLGQRIRAGDQEERFRLLLRLRPDVVCLGYDQPVETKRLRRFLDRHGMKGTRIARVRQAPGS